MAVIRIIILLIITLIPRAALSTNYYIDPVGGNDSWNGLSATYISGTTGPKLHFNDTAVRLAHAGDTVYLMDGVYGDGNGIYVITGQGNSGTAENPITITKYPGATPSFQGSGLYGVYVTLGLPYYIIDGLDFSGNNASIGTVLYLIKYGTPAANNTIVRNCTFSGFTRTNFNAAINIKTVGYITIEDNTFTSLGNVASGLGSGEAITVESSSYNTIQRNTINGAYHAGISLLAASATPAVFSTYNVITHNSIDQANGGGGIYLALQSNNNEISYNDIYNFGQGSGLTQNKAALDVASGPNNDIFSNTVHAGWGVSGSNLHRAIYLSSYSSGSFININVRDNNIHDNIIEPGYGIPIYIREGVGYHDQGVNLTNNSIYNNIIYPPIDALTGGDFINGTIISRKYSIYIGNYDYDGYYWPEFANGNKFRANHFMDSIGYIAYFPANHTTDQFSKTLSETRSSFPLVFLKQRYKISGSIIQ